jgi:hypothetical protein
MATKGSVWARLCSLSEASRELAEMELREMPVADLVEEAGTVGITLQAEGDRLRVRGPRETQALGQLLLERKQEVLALLRRGPRSDPGPAEGPAASSAPPAPASQPDTAAPMPCWDNDRARKVVAAVQARLELAASMIPLGHPKRQARLRVLEVMRATTEDFAAKQDPLLWERLQDLERRLAEWREWDNQAGRKSVAVEVHP